MRDFNCAFDAFARFPSVNLRPPHLADAIDKLNHAMCAIWFPCICSAVVALPVLL